MPILNMKIRHRIARFLVTLGLAAAPFAGVAAEDKTDGALMKPVKSILDNHLAIQKELANDSLKGVDEHRSVKRNGFTGS